MIKLLPRFVTSHDWTQAEAISLLDDVAYFSTEPIAARVAQAKLPSDGLWRTKVEFQDLPVKIAKWSEPLRGLRIGMNVAGGEWRIGGKVRLSLWLHNAGGKDVSFRTSSPNRQDVGFHVSAIGADGDEHGADFSKILILSMPMDCTLPAGHVAMVKEFDVEFAEPGNGAQEGGSPRFRELRPGKYQLRCKWAAESLKADFSKPSDWTGELSAPDFEFTLGGVAAPKTGAVNTGAVNTGANPPTPVSENVDLRKRVLKAEPAKSPEGLDLTK